MIHIGSNVKVLDSEHAGRVGRVHAVEFVGETLEVTLLVKGETLKVKGARLERTR